VHPLNQGGVGLALLRVDGFASLHAAERWGEVVTRPMRWPKADLLVNIDSRRNLLSHPYFNSTGEVRVEVRDALNRPIKGFAEADCTPMYHNTANLEDACIRVAWGRKSTSKLAGRTIRLAFRLRDAHLYSFRAKE